MKVLYGSLTENDTHLLILRGDEEDCFDTFNKACRMFPTRGVLLVSEYWDYVVTPIHKVVKYPDSFSDEEVVRILLDAFPKYDEESDPPVADLVRGVPPFVRLPVEHKTPDVQVLRITHKMGFPYDDADSVIEHSIQDIKRAIINELVEREEFWRKTVFIGHCENTVEVELRVQLSPKKELEVIKEYPF